MSEISRNSVKRLSVFAVVIAVFMVLTMAVCAAMPSEAHAAEQKVKWSKTSNGFKCKVDNRLMKNGIKLINDKFYYFDAKGIQRTGWRKIGANYYYFNPNVKANGYMVTSKVINGIKLRASGSAVQTTKTLPELKMMMKATKFVDTYARPYQKKSDQLRHCFDVLVHVYSERLITPWADNDGWWRDQASDIFDKKVGACYSYGAAFAYIANQIGYKKCEAVSSGGHGWAEIDGKIYDPEWTKHRSPRVYAIAPSRCGSGGIQSYSTSRVYVHLIGPRSKELGGKAIDNAANSNGDQDGLKKVGKNYYYYMNGKKITNSWMTIKSKKYYFKADGKAAIGLTKINGIYYAFNNKGHMRTGTLVSNGKFYSFGSNGKLNSAKTNELNDAAVIDQEATKLLQLLGTPKSKRFSESCYKMKMSDGSLMDGQDGLYTYSSFTVSTFIGTDGIEYYRGADTTASTEDSDGSAKDGKTKIKSGSSYLDKSVTNILNNKVKKTGDKGLKAAFRYVAKLGYKGGAKAPKGNWTVKFANKMIKNNGGNCYEAAALMTWLAKGLGYDAKAVVGKYNDHPHGWCEITKGKKTYILDVDNQRTSDKYDLGINFYKLDKAKYKKSYTKK